MAIGSKQTTISSWERDRTTPTRADVAKIANYLRVPATELEGLETEAPPVARVREVPVLSWVSAGRLSEVSDIAALPRNLETISVSDLPGGEYFATVVRGDSMDRISPEGSKIIVNASDRDPRPGRYYLFSLRGEATYKRYENDPVVRLEPYSTNPLNKIIYPKADKDWMVIGRVVRSYIDLG